MKKIYAVLMALMLTATMNLISCTKDESITELQQPPNVPDSGNEDSGNENEEINAMNINVGDRTFTVTLTDNETAQAFKKLLPMTITMNELNGNEKYNYLPYNLPTNAQHPGTIQAGDLMLYGSNCLVLFYDFFSSTYSYTRIGKVDNPSGLPEVVGAGSINVTLEIRNKE